MSRFVDLPNQAEREAIWEIQIGKHGRAPADFDLVQLAKATEGLTGSEIENVFIDALFLAFDSGKEPTDLDIARVLTEFVPLSKLMAEQIGSLRNWAKGRARLATSPGVERGLFEGRNPRPRRSRPLRSASARDSDEGE
jgi:SpoVK/Ycf46/Vps4 family AAA+-type ATPase